MSKRSRHFLLHLALCTAFLTSCFFAAQTIHAEEQSSSALDIPIPLFTSGEHGYAAFRIPALITSRNGVVLAFAEGRKDGAGDNGNIDIVLRRSTDDGKTWTPLSVVADMGTDSICNPCPVFDATTGRVWLPLIWKAGENNNTQNKRGTGRGTMEVFLTYSDDDGQTWAAPQNISVEAKRPDWTWVVTGPGNGIQLRSGRLLIPCDHRTRAERSDRASVSHVLFSDDHGKTWQIGGALERNTNECQIAELASGELLMSIRHHASPEKRRAFARSKDAGLTWSPVTFHPDLPDPTCQASLIALRDDRPSPIADPSSPKGKSKGDGTGERQLLFANPASPTARERMTVRLSHDGGATWPRIRVLHEGPAGYSALIELPHHRAACLYEQLSTSRKAPIVLVFHPFEVRALQ